MTEPGHWRLQPAPCPVCESWTSRFVGFRGGFAHHSGAGIALPIVRCRGCGLIYPNPMAVPSDQSHYSAREEYFGGVGFEQRIAAYEALLRQAADRLGRDPARMLDIGCGCGEALVAARRLGWDATGIEPSAEFVRIGRDQLGVRIDHGFVQDASYPARAFDLVLLSGVLEHVYDPVSVLGQAATLISDRGLLFVEVPNERSLYFAVGRWLHRLRGRDWCVNLSPTFPPYHVVGFSQRSLRVAVEKAGLKLTTCHTHAIDFRSQPTMPRSMSWPAALVEWIGRRANAGSELIAWVRHA